MVSLIEPIKIGRLMITPEQMEALRICRDYERLLDVAGWDEHSELKDLTRGNKPSKQRNGGRRRQGQSTRQPYVGYSS